MTKEILAIIRLIIAVPLTLIIFIGLIMLAISIGGIIMVGMITTLIVCAILLFIQFAVEALENK